MNEKLVTTLAGVLKVDPTELTTKLADEKGVDEVVSKIAEAKVFATNKDYLDHLNNYRASQVDIIKNEVYTNAKKDIHEAHEKELKREFGIENLEYGKDYKTTKELINHIITTKSKDSNTDKDKAEMLKKIEELNKAVETAPLKVREEYNAKITGMLLDTSINSIKSRVKADDDKIDEQLDYLKYKFEKEGYSITEKDGKYVVMKGEETVKNENFVPLSVQEVINQLAEKVLILKDKVPAGGRGGSQSGQNQNSGNSIDWSNYQTWDAFLKNNERGKSLTIGSTEANELYGQFMKAKGK